MSNKAAHFQHMTRVFLTAMPVVLFLLRLNLFELIKKNNYQGVSMSLIRKFATSMIQCLRLLFKEGIIHCDLKPVSSDVLVYWREGATKPQLGTAAVLSVECTVTFMDYPLS